MLGNISDIKDLYVSNNTIYIGDQHRLGVSDRGDLKFKKRITSDLPSVLKTISGTSKDSLVDYVNNTRSGHSNYQLLSQQNANTVAMENPYTFNGITVTKPI